MEDFYKLIRIGREGEYWDYKKQYSENKADKIHDIICMANNLANHDAYIFMGIGNQGEIIGIENDPNRMNQAEFVTLLRDKKFAGGYRPEIELETIWLENHEIDVLIIKNTFYTPYYLIEDYEDESGKTRPTRLKANHIYTRICDTNTPQNKSADLDKVERLWRKRFGIDLAPMDRYKLILKESDNWVMDWGNKHYAYYKPAPEYRMSCSEFDFGGYWPIAAFYSNPTMCFANLRLEYHSTILYETELWGMDEARLFIPKAHNTSADGNGKLWYQYYNLDDLEGELLQLMLGEDLNFRSRAEICIPFLVFKNENEKQKFDQYYLQNLDKFSDEMIYEEYGHYIDIDRREHGLICTAYQQIRAYLIYVSQKHMRKFPEL